MMFASELASLLRSPRMGTCQKWMSLVLTVVAALAGGCSHSDETEIGSRAFTGIATPLPPPLLNGPAAVLLTNLPGFSAHVELVHDSFAGRDEVMTGEVLGRGTKLLFAPDRDAPVKKNAPAGGFSYVWDLMENSGFVLSEALQAYAPVTSRLSVTNVAVHSKPALQKTVAGQVVFNEATLQMNDGTVRYFEVQKAPALKDFPVVITSLSNAIPLRASFSKVRLEAPPLDLFVPPKEFARYATPEALVDELFVRHHNLRRKSSESALPSQPPPH